MYKTKTHKKNNNNSWSSSFKKGNLDRVICTSYDTYISSSTHNSRLFRVLVFIVHRFMFVSCEYVCVCVCVYVVRVSWVFVLLLVLFFFVCFRVICLMFYLIEYEIATTLHGNIFQATQAIQAYLVDLIPTSLVHSLARRTVNLQRLGKCAKISEKFLASFFLESN